MRKAGDRQRPHRLSHRLSALHPVSCLSAQLESSILLSSETSPNSLSNSLTCSAYEDRDCSSVSSPWEKTKRVWGHVSMRYDLCLGVIIHPTPHFTAAAPTHTSSTCTCMWKQAQRVHTWNIISMVFGWVGAMTAGGQAQHSLPRTWTHTQQRPNDYTISSDLNKL